jgi:hypothetical protein
MFIHSLFNYVVSVAEIVYCRIRCVNGYGESERDLSYLKLLYYPDSAQKNMVDGGKPQSWL